MKYMGSKNRIAKYLLPIILKDRKEGQWYVEPFVGGCNSISKVDGNRIGGDINYYLISFLKALQNDWIPPKNINVDLYNNINKNKDNFPPELVGCIGFNFTYAAKFFGGFIGNSNDIVCKGRDRIGESYRSVEKGRKEVKGVKFIHCNYTELDIPKNSIIYCDPPYKNTTGYKDKFNHEDFYNWCRKMKNQGHIVFVSEYSMPDDFKVVWEKEVNSSLTKDTGSKKATEKLFTL